MNLRDMLEDEEGRVRYVYQDSRGYWTIGVGRLVDRRLGGGLSDDEIDYLLSNDIASKTAEVILHLPWVADLGEVRKDTVIAMAFQMGMNGLLGFKKTLRALEDKQWAIAAAEMLRSAWAKQTPARAQRMARQIETGEWQ